MHFLGNEALIKTLNLQGKERLCIMDVLLANVLKKLLGLQHPPVQRSSPIEAFSRNSSLNMCSKFTGKPRCGSVISNKFIFTFIGYTVKV